MVEGPGCKLKGLKIKAKLKGQQCLSVSGNAFDKARTKAKNGDNVFQKLIGHTLSDVQTLGKELFMYFDDICLRVHFLMSGQSFINHQKVDSEVGGKAETASLELQMSTDVLTFKNSSVELRSASACRKKYEELNNLDICSPVFSFTRAFSLVREQTDRQICDVLLDQSLLPGVGNIIKNEALFDSGIRPNSKVAELKDIHINHLLRMTRDFTNIFYQCRRDGKALYPYYKIYGKKRCGQCDGKVTICRLGDDNDRVTYFCDHCQTNDLKHQQRRLPTKNSLLGWVQTGNQGNTVDPAEWSCDQCTLINLGSSKTCSACLNPRTIKNPISDVKVSSEQGLQNRLTSGTLQECHIKTAAHEKRKLLDGSSQNPATFKRAKISQGNSTSNIDNQSVNRSMGSVKNIVKAIANTEKDHCEQQKEGLMTTTAVQSKIPLCPTHGKKCSMKEVRKEGPNTGRWFFSCIIRSCKFFEWADTRFPICTGHGKPCTIRTVMKIGPNNGRRFFTCKLPKHKQCKFFEWAEGYD